MFKQRSFYSYAIHLAASTLLTLGLCTEVNAQLQNNSQSKIPVDNWIQYYNSRYQLPDVFQKLIDNHGDGFESLYGTRNFRKVLSGALYRGGANNSYNRTNKRPNQNPLPDEALTNLCEEGFSTAIYLYTKNFTKAPHKINCDSVRETNQKLDYLQISPFDEKGLKQILSFILTNIRNPNRGPIYIHCWNGWHASGFVSASALMQFCGWTNVEAENYWDANTDGNNGSEFNSARMKVRNFKTFSELNMTREEQQIFCP